MKTHFSAAGCVTVRGTRVEIFDSSNPPNELAEFLRPMIIAVYNQFFVPPARPVARAGLPRIQVLLGSHIPTAANLKKSEFGEVLATLFIEQVKERTVPVYKHSHKTARNMPIFGMDCVAIALSEENGEAHLQLYFYEVKTTESTNLYPTVCYQIRDAFRAMNAETFDAEVAFIWRQLRNKGALSPHEELIIELLESVSYDNANLLLCPFLVAEAISYQDTFPIPFCSDEYERPAEPVVVRISGIDSVYKATMGGD